MSSRPFAPPDRRATLGRLSRLRLLILSLLVALGAATLGGSASGITLPIESGGVDVVPPYLFDLGLPIYCGGGRGPYVALTFDDGPGFDTQEVLDVLDRYHARATFFLIGQNVERHPDLALAETQHGVVGDHSWDHPSLSKLTPDGVASEISRTRTAIEAATGQPVDLFRPPFGDHEGPVEPVLHEQHILEVLWNVDSGDGSEVTTPPWPVIAQQLSDRVKSGAIILLHENITGSPDAKALEVFLPELLRRGYIPVTVPELLALDPPDPVQIAKGRGGCHALWHPPGG